MTVKDISFATAALNIFYDEAMLEASESGMQDEVLRFWEAERFSVVAGRISSIPDDVKVEQASADGIEVIRRMSGGGTVVQGPGCLNYTLILSYERDKSLRDIRRSYEYILCNMCGAMKKLGVLAGFEPASDMVMEGRKFSGNAQIRKRRFILHHGTILYGFCLDLMEKYLFIPKNQPAYRKNRSHADFLVNIGIKPPLLKEAISSIWER